MQKFGGVSRCFAELYKHLPQNVHAKIGVRESDNVYIQDVEGVHPVGYAYEHFICNKYFYGKGRLHILYDRITRGGYYPNSELNYSISLLKKGNFDVFHPTFFSNYFIPFLGKKPFVLTIHDMIPELYPQYFKKNDFQMVMRKELAPKASAIITVSMNTKKDVVRLLKVPEEKVHVVHHGCSFPKESKVQISINEGNPYILYVGERGCYKNFNLFFKHIIPFLKKHPEVSVVCTGRPFSGDEIKMFESQGLLSRFIYYWVKTDEEFFSLYHQALCFIYPSEYEGFGIPILEAYQADCPVLLNNASCFPEIAGDAAIYFDLNIKESNIVERLEQVYSFSDRELNDLLLKQRERLACYSWDKNAERTADIYCKFVQ